MKISASALLWLAAMMFAGQAHAEVTFFNQTGFNVCIQSPLDEELYSCPLAVSPGAQASASGGVSPRVVWCSAQCEGVGAMRYEKFIVPVCSGTGFFSVADGYSIYIYDDHVRICNGTNTAWGPRCESMSVGEVGCYLKVGPAN